MIEFVEPAVGTRFSEPCHRHRRMHFIVWPAGGSGNIETSGKAAAPSKTRILSHGVTRLLHRLDIEPEDWSRRPRDDVAFTHIRMGELLTGRHKAPSVAR